MNWLRDKWRGMAAKVKAAFITAGVLAVGAGVDYLASVDWITELGPWAAPLAAGLTWFAAYWKTEHTGGGA